MLTFAFIKGLYKIGMSTPQMRLATFSALVSFSVFYLFITAKLRRYLHMLQLSNYYNTRFLKWIVKKQAFIISWDELALSIITLVSYYVKGRVIIPILMLTLIYLSFKYFTKREKKTFVFTSRAKRILTLSLALNTLFLLLSFQYFFEHIGSYIGNIDFYALVFLNLIGLSIFIVPILSNVILYPLEYLIQQYYIRDAKAIMASVDTKVIGITGSYGKTSTKHILNDILCEQFSSLATPGSINTELGVTKVIRQDLKSTHKFFVVEMGARLKNDIAKVCNITKPDYAVVTAIGNQHLETFKSKQDIAKAKFEIVDNLSKYGILFLNADDKEVMKFSEKIENRRVVTFGSNVKADYIIRGVTNTHNGLVFNIQHKNKEYKMDTLLLGAHSAMNIVAAVSVAHTLGVSFDKIISSVKRLQPIKHRLQLINKENGVKVLDNAFNSNLIGAKSAVDAMRAMKTKNNKTVIVTPGMVELGALEDQMNIEFAKYAAKKCDFIIVVGKNQGRALIKGLEISKLSKDQYFIAQDLNQAIAKLNTIVKAGDVVLFENDLPDQYN